jgi:(2Fe-2S) ferredoxin
MAKRPKVYVCKGSHCSKCKDERAALLATLESAAKVREVGCQKMCKGPVVGVEVDGCLEWFADLGSGKARRGLDKLIDQGRLSKALAKRQVAKRSGQRR